MILVVYQIVLNFLLGGNGPLNSQPDEEERQSLVNRQLNFNPNLGAGDGLLKPQAI